MIHIESNPLPSGFVPALPITEGESVKPVTSVNGHTIESLSETAAFNHLCGNNLDRLCAASKELRALATNDNAKAARSFAQRFIPKFSKK